MNAVNHMAQSESKENAIAKHKKETHIRMKKSCLEKCLISYKKNHSERKKQENHPFGSRILYSQFGKKSHKHTHQ